ncbi:hypothetical protein FISHEDRAFT_67145 [Fistulina hepatica ATCC 64428]|uniref:DNA mismatch repair proteins mutS family domain-containing protein n=1 Tax=Fistulina hepatica ATCC 64428 TaxID=1128425 RepID=A0A0D7A394_9AGAR|nr:hypothetical protein FISHEDRAFT_67145 [Fistulina hepatica ATCC 64428]
MPTALKRKRTITKSRTDKDAFSPPRSISSAKKTYCSDDEDATTVEDTTAEESNTVDVDDHFKERVRYHFHLPRRYLISCEQSYLVIWCRLGRIGGAFYDPVKCVVNVLEDTQETAHYDLTQTLLEQSNASVVLTSSRSDDAFIDKLRDHMEATGGTFQIRLAKDFSPKKGHDRLTSLPLLRDLPQVVDPDDSNPVSEGDSGASGLRNAYDFMHSRRGVNGDPTMQKWNASIRIFNYASVEVAPFCLSCIGVLLDQLSRDRAVHDLGDEGADGLDVRRIEVFALDEAMQINADALRSLQIFEEESHASVHSNKTKEGLSLFGIINTTKTRLGRALLRTWFLRPSLSLDIISRRHDAVACFVHSENYSPVNAIHAHLKGIKNVPRILSVMKSGRAKIVEWQGIVKFTFHATMLRESLAELFYTDGVEIIAKLLGIIDVHTLKEVATRINDIVDWEQSDETGRVCVRPGIDEELDNRRHVYNGIDSILSKVARQICETVPEEFAVSLNVVYFPQLGFLVCTPMLDEWRTEKGIQVLDGWTFQVSLVLFIAYDFYPTLHAVFLGELADMDQHVGDLHSLIVDKEIEIIHELTTELFDYHDNMSAVCDVCAELDCLLAFAEASQMYNYNRPIMVDDNVIEIIGGRHPLQEQVVDTFVANDVHIAGGIGTYSRCGDGSEYLKPVALCTGANACGKSVYLKQTALIQYMAQVFVPAEAAYLGVVDKIFTRISTRESVSRVQSAFMIDLNQVSLALRSSTARSLILLDEFGKGTLSTDGAGLFCGVVKHLLDRGPDCPKVMAATHFHDIFKEDLLDPESAPIEFLHMQVLFETSDGKILGVDSSVVSPAARSARLHCAAQSDGGEQGAGRKITYLYRVGRGLSFESHAAQCAEIFGVPEHVVQRARYVSWLISQHELVRLLDEDMSDSERQELHEAEEICRRFLQWNLQSEGNTYDVKAKLAEILGRDAAF